MELDLAAFANKEILDYSMKMNSLIQKSSRSEQAKSQPPETGNAETSLESLLVLTEDSF